MLNLESFRVEKCPNTVFYVPNFISEEEERFLMQKVNDSPKPKWTQLKNRRLQNWGGIPQAKGMIAEKIPEWLNDYCKKINDLGVFESNFPNHILINEYLSGQGIMPHEDGSLYYPTVTTISLGSHTILDFYKTISDSDSGSNIEDRYMFSLLVEPRSLLVLRDDIYKVYLHGIKEITQDFIQSNLIGNYEKLSREYSEGSILKRDTRISLTIRHVPKTLKINPNSLFFNKK